MSKTQPTHEKKWGGAKDGNAYFFEETIEVTLDS